MSFPKILVTLSLFLFGAIFLMALFKGEKSESTATAASRTVTLELDLNNEKGVAITEELVEQIPVRRLTDDSALPDANRIEELFNIGEPKLPIVETIRYSSRVPWKKGRAAWIADYATHYNTSRYFISRSLAGKVDYFAQKIANGDLFNVLKEDKKLDFHLVVDLSRSKMWFYYFDADTNDRVLLKTYPVGLGRVESKKKSGYLTPLGTYLLGDRVALYKPGAMGYFNHKKVEMIRIFGTRWIPFEKAIAGCTAPAKGFGIHGSPWIEDPATKKLTEDSDSIGKYESDGCIRLNLEDIEELFSIIITKPTYVQIVADFNDANLPGLEKGI